MGPGGHPRRAVIAMGGNLGDRLATIRRAMRRVDGLRGTRILAASSVYETPALTLDGIDESAPRYLNAVVIVTTTLTPHELLSELQRLESSFGRQRGVRWGSRTLDLDLIDVEGVEVTSESLELPHPRAWQRAFVLAPWHEIDPDAHLAGRGSIASLLGVASDRVELFAESGLPGRSPHPVLSDRGLPLVGPASQCAAARPDRRGGCGGGVRGGAALARAGGAGGDVRDGGVRDGGVRDGDAGEGGTGDGCAARDGGAADVGAADVDADTDGGAA